MQRLAIAQRELRTLRSELMAKALEGRPVVPALATIQFILAQLQVLELQLSGIPTPMSILERLEQMGAAARAEITK